MTQPPTSTRTRLLVPLDDLHATSQQFRAQAPLIEEQVRAPLQATEQAHGPMWQGVARERYSELHQGLVQSLDHMQSRIGTLGTQLGHHASYYAVLNAMRFGEAPGAPTVASGLEPAEAERVAGKARKPFKWAAVLPGNFGTGPFDTQIAAALNSGEEEKMLEGVLGLHLRNDLVSYDRKVPGGTVVTRSGVTITIPAGQIDAETGDAIYEATISKGGKNEQVRDRHMGKAVNPTGKPVIVFAPYYSPQGAAEVEALGGYVVRRGSEDVTEAQLWDQLDQLIAKLRAGESPQAIHAWQQDWWERERQAFIAAQRLKGRSS